MWHTVFFTLACLVLPVVWGVLINWAFNLWQARSNRSNGNNDEDQPVFPDYQI